MTAMFGCTFNLAELNLSSFDTSNVTQMSYMFHGTYVQKLDLSSFNTSNVINMYSMFEATSRLREINFGNNFNTEKVTNMGRMFTNTPALLGLNLAKFNTKNVTNMAHMFGSMNAIENLSLTSFDTSNVTTMNGMFSSMPNLKTLDISTFNTQNVTDMGYIFAINNYDSDNLTTIYAGDNFVTNNVVNSQGIFNYRKKLRGGNGSYLVDPNMADKSWLRIDRPGAKGYFTQKP